MCWWDVKPYSINQSFAFAFDKFWKSKFAFDEYEFWPALSHPKYCMPYKNCCFLWFMVVLMLPFAESQLVASVPSSSYSAIIISIIIVVTVIFVVIMVLWLFLKYRFTVCRKWLRRWHLMLARTEFCWKPDPMFTALTSTYHFFSFKMNVSLSSIVEQRLEFTEIMSQSAHVYVFWFSTDCEMRIEYARCFMFVPAVSHRRQSTEAFVGDLWSTLQITRWISKLN